jgi:hypothetical protein
LACFLAFDPASPGARSNDIIACTAVLGVAKVSKNSNCGSIAQTVERTSLGESERVTGFGCKSRDESERRTAKGRIPREMVESSLNLISSERSEPDALSRPAGSEILLQERSRVSNRGTESKDGGLFKQQPLKESPRRDGQKSNHRGRLGSRLGGSTPDDNESFPPPLTELRVVSSVSVFFALVTSRSTPSSHSRSLSLRSRYRRLRICGRERT